MWVQALGSTDTGDWRSRDDAPLREPNLVFLFGPTDCMRTSAAPSRLAALFPDAIQIGCSTGTTIDGRVLSDDVISAIAIGFDRTQVKLATYSLIDSDSSRAAGEEIGKQLAAPDLTAVFVLSEGLGVNGSALVEGLSATCGAGVAISGGLAGDGARFADTLVTVGGKSAPNIVAAIGLYGSSIRVGHGSAGGWDEFGPLRKITRSSGNVLSELDGKPALDLYERYLGDEAAALPASALFYPLKIWDPAHPEDAVVRTVLSIDCDARTMTFAGDIPAGWSSRLMRGSFDRLTEGAAEAARRARETMTGAESEAGLCLLVSCVGRRLLMGQRAEEEVEAVANVLGAATPIAGFYSYGEIARNYHSGVSCLHNQTVTLTLLAEAA
jgi:hypothetical protein